MADGAYLYAVLNKCDGLECSEPGVGGRPVRVMRHLDLMVLWSQAPVKNYEPNEDNALAHEKVLESVVKDHTVLPVAFGMLAPSDRALKDLITKNYGGIKTQLRKIEGCVEFGLKILWNRDAVLKEIVDESPALQAERERIGAKSEASRYYDNIELGKILERQLDVRREYYRERIEERLRSECLDVKFNKLISDRMVVNAAFLVRREEEAKLDAGVNELAERFSATLKFKYTGPWAPFNFVTVRFRG
jgi:hypothetical protein